MSGVLSSRTGLAVVLTLLFNSGSMCPKCGHGTRATSKRWAKCKKCGESKIPRQSIEKSADELKAKLAAKA